MRPHTSRTETLQPPHHDPRFRAQWYCPQNKLSSPTSAPAADSASKVGTVDATPVNNTSLSRYTWRTPWATYVCKAVHSHALVDQGEQIRAQVVDTRCAHANDEEGCEEEGGISSARRGAFARGERERARGISRILYP